MEINIKIDAQSFAVALKKFFKSKVTIILLLVALAGTAVLITAGTVTKPHNFSNYDIIDASQMNANFDTLYNLVNGNLDDANLSPSSRVPAGTIIMWYRNPSTLPAIPTGYAVCDGSLINAPGSEFHGLNAPNLIDKFVRGATLGNNGNAGGSDTVDLQHSHSVSFTSGAGGSHSHSLNNHTHTTPNHKHLIGYDTGGSWFRFYQDVVIGPTENFSSAYEWDFVEHDPATNQYRYYYSDTSGSGNTSVPDNNSTGSESAHTHTISGTSGNALTNTPGNNVPAYVGLLPLIKL